MMSLRSKALTLVEVLLRVPPLFVVDEFLKISLGLPTFVDEDEEASNVSNVTVNFEEIMADSERHIKAFKTLFFIAIKFSICFLGCFAAACVFLLYTKHLIIVYLYLISLGIVFVSYWINVSTIKQFEDITQAASSPYSASILEDIFDFNFKDVFDLEGPGILMLQNLAIQFLLSILFRNVHLGPQHPRVQKLLPLSFMVPSFLAMLPVSAKLLNNSPILASLLPLVLLQYVIWASSYDIVKVIYSGYQHGRLFASRNGLSALIETEWLRLNVFCVLRVFWVIRVTESAILLLNNNLEEVDEELKTSSQLSVQWLASMAKSLIITGSETITAVLGMTSVISFFCHYFGRFFQWILLMNPDEDNSIGTVSAILFYLLALQTGLTSLNPEKRFIRLCRNFCLLVTALLHFLHHIVNPILMSVTASQNPRTHRHARALGVCAYLIIFPISFLAYLWSQYSASTWLLAVSAFSIEVIFKVLISLLIYSLFLFDAYRSTFWEKLDDSVYYIRAFGSTIEFFIGIFLFAMGGWNLLFESGSAMRAVMMCVHAYFNIWCKAKSGWSVLMKRRTAVNKINSLQEATADQLKVEDVCAICYQEMRSAKITSCNHFFHGVCLRKWLYVQDKCPLCHEILYKIDADADAEADDADDDDDDHDDPNEDNYGEDY